MKPNVWIGRTVLYVLPNGSSKPCVVTHISNVERGSIDATLFNNTETGDHPNNSILRNIPFDEKETIPNTWHPTLEEGQTRSATAAGTTR